ncbi:MAG TPA: dephospho-CoA kinase [Lacipirellulaceae bacterium]
MKTLGIVGGVASGKSLVSQYLSELGAGVLDADKASHEVLANDPHVHDALVNRWGRSILNDAGQIDRKAVATRLFADANDPAGEDRKFLEKLLHPRIRERLDEQRQAFAREGRPAVVLDAPLLLEALWGPMCDVIVMVDAPREMRLAHASERGWTEAEFDRRESAQWPVEEKRRHATVVLENVGSPADLRDAARQIWSEHVQQP